MKIHNFLKNDCEKENFKREILANNVYNGRILAKIAIGFELVFSIIDIGASILEVDNRFRFNDYLIMYSAMIIINAVYLIFLNGFKNLEDKSINQLRRLEIVIVVYLTFMLSWGSIIALMDQKLYGQLTAFMVNIMICSVFYCLEMKKMLVPYVCSVVIILIGLPSFQVSSDILFGHYINLFFFLVISWFTSRVIYQSFCKNLKSKKLLQQEVEKNTIINNRLTEVNLQLKEQALIDELTGMPNRRSFGNYIDMAFDNYFKENPLISFIMLDIDYFKQFNDSYGHGEGDKVIIAVANQIKSIVRHSMDFAARWGGEEFIYVAFDMDAEDIKRVAETIRKKVCELKIPHEFSKIDNYISVSVGACTIKGGGKEHVGKGFELVDKALYLAKNNGRNCIRYLQKDNNDFLDSEVYTPITVSAMLPGNDDFAGIDLAKERKEEPVKVMK